MINYEKSFYYLEESLKIHQKHFDDQHVKMGWLLFHLATTYKAMGQREEAQKLFDKVLKIYVNYRGEDNIEKARLLRSIARIYFERNLLNEAENFITEALRIFQPYNHVESYRSLKTQGEILLKKSTCAKDSLERQDLRNQAIDSLIRALKIAERHFPKGSNNIQKITVRIQQIKSKN